jgi:LysM domain
MATTHARTPATPQSDMLGRTPREGSARPTHLWLVTAPDAARATAIRPGTGPRRPSAARRQPPLRLTRRGRLVLRGLVVLVMLALMAGAALTMAHRADAADGAARHVVVAHHVVLPGETLWSIATSLAPMADPRDTIGRIVEFNALASSEVHAGQSLAIPPDLPGH